MSYFVFALFILLMGILVFKSRTYRVYANRFWFSLV